MIYEKIHLKKFYPFLKYDPVLEVMSPEVSLLPDGETPMRSLMLVIGGGAYEYVSEREMDPVSIAFMKLGFVCAQIFYTCKKTLKKDELLYPHPMHEVICAIDYLRKHNNKFRFNNNEISLIGFSAGGHLAASTCAHYKDYAKQIGLKEKNVEPNALVLGYPVIEFSYPSGTRKNLTNEDKKLFEYLSIEKNVNKKFPPTFIWVTDDDQAVPSKNSKNFAKVLDKSGVVHQLVVFPHGPHGLSTLDVTTSGLFDQKIFKKVLNVQKWIDMAAIFLHKVYKKH